MSTYTILRRASRTAIWRPITCVPRQRLPFQVNAQRTVTTASHNQSAKTETATKGTSKEVRFTSESYPKLQRESRFATLTQDDVDYFKSICPVVSLDAGETADLEPFNTDWMRKYRGQSKLVVKPKSTEDVSKVIKYCDERRLAVVPQGGNTGLVGGGVPIFDEIVISMQGLNNIRAFDSVSGIFVCDAGVILETADNYLRERDHIFPLDLGAKGSCHVGGTVATNAGGLRLLRYGSLHGTVLGVEVVLPDGTILDDLHVLRKNNTGYDLKQLFIGSEGTIGIITAVSIVCPQKPKAQNVAFFAVNSYEKVQQAFVKTKKQLSEILSAFELMDSTSQRLVRQVTGKKNPLQSESSFYVLIETSGSNAEHDNEKLSILLESLVETETVMDGTLAESEMQARELWSYREGIPEVLGHWGGVYKYDVSIPLSELYALVDDVRERMREEGLLSTTENPENVVVEVVGFGHMGDSNLHLNVPVRHYDKRVENVLEPFVYEWIQKRRGSISAEHGLGFAKRDYVNYSRGGTELEVMKRLKIMFDPNGIMNPYKYIDA